MKALLIGLIAMVAIAAGVFAAGIAGYGPISYISYHVQASNSSNQSSAEIIPAYINLGNLTPGMQGTITANASISLNNNGTYEISLEHQDKLSKVFSEFNVTITIGNKTVILTLSNDNAYLNLSTGNYNIYIKISYQVSNQPHGDLSVTNEPLLTIHPYGDSSNNS